MKMKKFCFGNVPDKLSDRELKRLLGGYGETEPWPGPVSGTCGTGGGGDSYCCISKAEALEIFENEGFSNWCCDSCPTTPYCGQWTC